MEIAAARSMATMSDPAPNRARTEGGLGGLCVKFTKIWHVSAHGAPSHWPEAGGGPLDFVCDPHHTCAVTSVRAWVGASVRRWWLGFSSITAETIRRPRPVGCTTDLPKVSGGTISSWMSTIFLLGSTS